MLAAFGECPWDRSAPMKRTPLLVAMLLIAPFAAAETWLRVDAPSPALRANLPVRAIDYVTFVWMPEDGAPTGLLGAQVQRSARPFDLVIDGQRFDPTAAPVSSDPWRQSATFAGPDFRLVQLYGPPRATDLDALRAANVRPVRYLAPFSYIVWASAEDLQTLASRSTAIRWSGAFLPAQRVPPQSRDLDAGPTRAMALLDATSADAVIAALPSARLVERTSMTPDLTLVELELPGSAFLAAARTPGVYTLQRIDGGAGPRGEMSNQSVVGGYDAGNVVFPGYTDWLSQAGVNGAGIKVSIVDGGMRTTHADLAANMVPCTGIEGSCAVAIDNHGTHVAGAVAGSGASGVRDSAQFLRGQGIAPGASLIQQRYGPFLGAGPGSMVANGMLRIYKDAAVSGAQLANNSWGPTSTPQGYDIPTLQVDMIARDADPTVAGSQPVLPVWSIMNGNGDRNSGICAPSSLGSPDEAKNLFAIGSTKMQVGGGTQLPGIFDVSANSAHGPACDGRLVPHVVAPGCSTDSASSAGDNSFTFMCGTSMASPVVSGAAALYWQRHRATFGRDPSPALVKAMFTAVAKNLTGFLDADGGVMPQRPNRFSGWGRLDLDAVINPGVEVWLHDQELVLANTGATFAVDQQADDPARPVRIMLAWTDAPGPGTGGTTPSWTNDLDLGVTLGAQSWRGNVFDAATGWSATGGSADGKNNLEGVFLSPAQHAGGSFRVNVLAATVAADALDPWLPVSPRQDFAIVCYNCKPSTVVVDDVFADGFDGETPVDDLFADGFED
jgi:subtilisin family serine protease